MQSLNFLPETRNQFFRRRAVTRTLPCLKLKTELWRRGIKQIDLALSIRVDPSRLSKFVNGREEMPPEIRQSIAQWLGTDESHLF